MRENAEKSQKNLCMPQLFHAKNISGKGASDASYSSEMTCSGELTYIV